jgi:hypothetical protein
MLCPVEPVLAHSARAITLAHRAPLINTTPHGATRMAVLATADPTRSHAGAPVRAPGTELQTDVVEGNLQFYIDEARSMKPLASA